MKFQINVNTIRKQQGAALITALVFMGILTMLGISAMRSSTLDLKIHNAMKNRLNAFQCAEAALRQGELFIRNSTGKPDDTGSVIPDKTANQVWNTSTTQLNNMLNQDDSWWVTNGWEDTALSDPSVASIVVGCASSARYMVYSMGGMATTGGGDLSFRAEAESMVSGYRISSRSEGVSSGAAVILQSTFLRQFN